MSHALTLGVIGHVDHGKTALVRALTGAETDRLKEERERGLSIVLGFAYLETEHGVIDLIDVPGHEAFIRAMIAGATALDGILLCVAANEGVMPQTVEHFNIARLLGIERGLVVMTKADLVDAETLELARAELDDFLRGTFLAGAPRIEVSALEGLGIDNVVRAISRIAATPVERATRGRCFLPFDRVFTMRGFGVVGTGTLRGGNLEVGDIVQIMPSGRQAAVRALQNHNESVDLVKPGNRVAVNLRHVDRDEVRRGDVLAAPGSIKPSRRLDAELSLLENAAAPLRNGSTVRLLTGTTEVMTKVRLLDRREILPGETALVQLRLDRDIATLPGEHCLLRSYSPVTTIGGGRFLEVNPKRHRRFDPGVTKRLENMAKGDLNAVVKLRLDAAAAHGVEVISLAEEIGLERSELEAMLEHLDVVYVGDDTVIAANAYSQLLSEILDVLERFHQRYPLKKGLDLGRLAAELQSGSQDRVLRHAIHQLVEQGRLLSVREALSLSGHDPFARLGPSERSLATKLEQAFLSYGLEPPAPDAVIGSQKVSKEIFQLLLESGQLVRLKTYKSRADLVLHADVFEQAKRAIKAKFPYPDVFALKDIRDLLGSTRKYVVPLMEHLDATGATVRTGDLRRLRE